MNREMSKIERGVAIGLCVALFMLLIYRIIYTIQGFDTTGIYNGFFISEYMINYQGGFIRRGLLGELLYQIFLIHPYPFPIVILWFEIIVFTIFVIIVCYIFYKKQWLPIMPLAIFYESILGFRRDFLMLLFAFVVFYLMFQYLQQKRRVFLFYSILLCTISIFTYEPSFFFIVPILMFLYWNSLEQKEIVHNISNVLKVFFIPLLCMFFVCTAKGSKDIADVIWNSWQPLFDYQGVICEKIGNAVAFLGMPSKDAIMMHLGYNYGIGTHEKYGFNPLVVSGSLLMFIGIYFLMVKIPSLKHQTKGNKILLSDMYIFQFICLLPMFTILSCDFGRTINYVIYTTYFLVFFIEKHQVRYNLPMISKFSNNVCRICDNRVMSSLWFYIIVLMLMPFGMYCGVTILHPLGHEYICLILPKIQSFLAILGL